ncbi:MAG: chemotaxis protein CheX [Clostridia bacterium]|nr:chemotaxis protein CheX [Clostridia bacterium]
MRAEFINPFITAAREVLKSEIRSEVQLGQLTMEQSAFQNTEVKVMISLTGELEGIVFYGLDKDTACNITSAMIGEKVSQFDDMVNSAIGEMGNVICGRAGGIFEKVGYNTNISTPIVLIGQNAGITTFNLQPILVSLVTDAGTIVLWVSLRKAILPQE